MTRNLEIRLLNYFLLITLAALMIGGEFFFEINSKISDINELMSTMGRESLVLDQKIIGNLTHIRNKIVVMFGVLSVVIAIILLMFIRNISRPLRKITKVAEAINQGDLSQIITVDSHDEIGQVGMAINELRSNLQEIVALTSITNTTIIEGLVKLSNNLQTDRPVTVRDLTRLRHDLETLHEFIESFQLFQIDDQVKQ
ncbi:hypothetical protein TI04_09365 [Achromatium sp. WMS2]|nr:hypothetical protein TI04_09365 [Achromatium sp. WMS2]